MEKFDFSGWATKNNLKCSDGRTIMKDAFKHNDGKKVPLVWNHQHNDPLNVVGYGLLENREEGVYAYGKFNETEAGKTAKLLVQHGDVTALSIYANQLKQQGSNVIHGAICEISLVLAGANPGAYIDSVITHGEESEEEAIIYTGDEFSMSDLEPKETKKVEESPVNEKKEPAPIIHAEESKKDKTVKDVIDTLTEEQKTVVYALLGEALASGEEDDPDEANHSAINNENEGDKTNMKKNVFDSETETKEGTTLSHSDIQAIITDAKRVGSLKDAVLAHGITDIEYLFPDATSLNNPPSLITRDMSWVSQVMKGVHHTPFSRIKSMFANLTEDEARAKGYIKGNLKLEEVFSLLKRTTTPTTIYKKQKLDRDDVIDITDFDVVAWLKSEMRMMLDEEIARAVLIGDGRIISSDDKINEGNIRPIWTDADLYTVKQLVTIDPAGTTDQATKAFIQAAVRARKYYKGSGNATLYTSETVLTDCLLMEDGVGRVIYDTVDKLANALRVKDIITVPAFDGLTRTDNILGPVYLLGLIGNLVDYNIGADKGGAVNMFDDFDIDYNAQKYLIETRCSGALIKPYSFIALETTTIPRGIGD
ncbi:MAG: phage major capsid protein [Clostridia bacterium]|nr:phage major capsid protein [Clostridia bacterium]